MNPDMPFYFAQDALKNCVGYLKDAAQAQSTEEILDELDGAADYAQKALSALHDAAYYMNDIGSDLPGVRQPEFVREVIDSSAAAAYERLVILTAGFAHVDVKKVKLSEIPVSYLEKFMDDYAENISQEKEFAESLPEPTC